MKNDGAEWLSRSDTAGSAKQTLRTRSSCSIMSLSMLIGDQSTRCKQRQRRAAMIGVSRLDASRRFEP